MNLSRNQKAFFSAWAIVLVALGGLAFGAFPVAGAVLVLILGALLWVGVLRLTHPKLQHLPIVDRFSIGDGGPGRPPAEPHDPTAPTSRRSSVTRTGALSGRPAPPPDQLSELSVVIPVDAEEQARLAAERKARDEERAAERERTRRERDEAKAAEKERKRLAREEAAAARRAEDEARRAREQAEAAEQAEAEAAEQAEAEAAEQAEADRVEAERLAVEEA
ncbi:MAG: hypothetical protein ACXV8G_01845, partial [Acidimicrobiales bacterium]